MFYRKKNQSKKNLNKAKTKRDCRNVGRNTKQSLVSLRPRFVKTLCVHKPALAEPDLCEHKGLPKAWVLPKTFKNLIPHIRGFGLGPKNPLCYQSALGLGAHLAFTKY